MDAKGHSDVSHPLKGALDSRQKEVMARNSGKDDAEQDVGTFINTIIEGKTATEGKTSTEAKTASEAKTGAIVQTSEVEATKQARSSVTRRMSGTVATNQAMASPVKQRDAVVKKSSPAMNKAYSLLGVLGERKAAIRQAKLASPREQMAAATPTASPRKRTKTKAGANTCAFIEWIA